MFKEYFDNLPSAEKAALADVVHIVLEVEPTAVEGLSYGLPALKYNDRPLIGFSSNKHGLNIYPFDPKIISEIVSERPGLEHSKGVIRFTVEHPLPEEVVVLMTRLRLANIR